MTVTSLMFPLTFVTVTCREKRPPVVGTPDSFTATAATGTMRSGSVARICSISVWAIDSALSRCAPSVCMAMDCVRTLDTLSTPTVRMTIAMMTSMRPKPVSARPSNRSIRPSRLIATPL